MAISQKTKALRATLTAILVGALSITVTGCAPPTDVGGDNTADGQSTGSQVTSLGTVEALMSSADIVLYLPAQLGPQEGKFDKCGVDVNISLGKSDTVSPAFVSGQADIAVQFGGRAVGDIMNGVPAKVVAAQTPPWVMPLAISTELYESGFKTPEDLKRLGEDGSRARFGITSIGAATHFSLLKLAELYGWTEGKEYEFIALGGIGEVTAALEAGEIDAFVYNRDVIMRVQDEGLAHVFDRDVIAEAVGPTLKEVFMASDEFIENHPDVLKAYFECYFDYVEELKSDLDQVKELAVENFGSSPEALDATLAEDVGDWSSDGSATDAELEGLAANTMFQNTSVTSAPVEDWWIYWKDI